MYPFQVKTEHSFQNKMDKIITILQYNVNEINLKILHAFTW